MLLLYLMHRQFLFLHSTFEKCNVVNTVLKFFVVIQCRELQVFCCIQTKEQNIIIHILEVASKGTIIDQCEQSQARSTNKVKSFYRLATSMA